jgi:hypothetical protein
MFCTGTFFKIKDCEEGDHIIHRVTLYYGILYDLDYINYPTQAHEDMTPTLAIHTRALIIQPIALPKILRVES